MLSFDHIPPGLLVRGHCNRFPLPIIDDLLGFQLLVDSKFQIPLAMFAWFLSHNWEDILAEDRFWLRISKQLFGDLRFFGEFVILVLDPNFF